MNVFIKARSVNHKTQSANKLLGKCVGYIVMTKLNLAAAPPILKYQHK